MTWWREGGLGDLDYDAPLSHDAIPSTTPSFLRGRLSGTSGNPPYAKPVSRSQAVVPCSHQPVGASPATTGDMLGRG
ncbi:Uncharacterized protein HZ326_23469 [Fusarium oxysporum f. sp. albedinis]|nr:Uncharacterized protein HZ326_23469 [Fusarium oxysporum f. sp. albedinis]